MQTGIFIYFLLFFWISRHKTPSVLSQQSWLVLFV